ncbi:MerR family transcriptional regulator [Halospina denitrificans]|uniref:MerR family transcriptional regulator n=1 Tax=Halospina denitrificans TaxID=332522 RepID=A0A4R7K0E8_9GAMM|nr:chaperone modulator CbpM [Halospina denitrificans]TDT44025.1 MerR family transcriptional regulator [Halospina denitrificans]
MARNSTEAEMMDEFMQLTLHELCYDCQVNAEYVIELVEFGIVQPRRGRTPREWVFAGEDLVRVKKAERLRRDLEVNLPGVALSLDLIEEVRALRRQVEDLQRAFYRDE